MPAKKLTTAKPTAAETQTIELLAQAVTGLGGTLRQGQQDMAVAATRAMESGRHLLVQAGTGTGKSLGYLVPAVRHAVTQGERVIVSTATLALQRQIMTRDLPLVVGAVAGSLPRKPDIALLKGWNNYACLHKVQGGYPQDDPGALFDLPGAPTTSEIPEQSAADAGSLVAQVKRLHAWIAETDTGDRDDLVPGVTERAWQQVSVSKLECLGTKCPLIDECFPERAKRIAFEADVVVTNHSMLGIASTGSPHVLPEFSVVVVDEAHELNDRVTASASVELSLSSIDHAARLARRNGGVTTAELDRAGEDFAKVLAELPQESFPMGLPDDARLAIAGVRDSARELLTLLKPAKDSPKESDSGLKMAQSAVLVLFEIAERMAADHTGVDVIWCSAGRFGSQEGINRLHAAPIGVAGLLRNNLWAEHTGILTSATLSLGDSFDHVARGAGVAAKDESGVPWDAMDVGSPFDYAKQGILYIAKDLKAPGQESTIELQLDVMADLISAAKGRTLGLFSSRKAAERAAEAMRKRLDFPILCQGDDQLSTLVQQFSEDDQTCLFGTLSLWQGVDVPGTACQLVLIDRIPFPRPDDPVKAARARAVEKAGGNGFMQVSATHAALLLAQGAGRLIRSADDRGVVAVLDPRLATARYGSFLVRSLPDFWPTADKNVAISALTRLSALKSD